MSWEDWLPEGLVGDCELVTTGQFPDTGQLKYCAGGSGNVVRPKVKGKGFMKLAN